MQVKDILSSIEKVDEDFYAEVNGYVFSLAKDGKEEDWYIQVKPEAQGHLYDGWWPYSEDKDLSEAIEEALIGSGLISK